MENVPDVSLFVGYNEFELLSFQAHHNRHKMSSPIKSTDLPLHDAIPYLWGEIKDSSNINLLSKDPTMSVKILNGAGDLDPMPQDEFDYLEGEIQNLIRESLS